MNSHHDRFIFIIRVIPTIRYTTFYLHIILTSFIIYSRNYHSILYRSFKC